MQGLGSDSSYNPSNGGGYGGGGGGGGGGEILGALGGMWGKVASATRESVAAANEELKKRELGKDRVGTNVGTRCTIFIFQMLLNSACFLHSDPRRM